MALIGAAGSASPTYVEPHQRDAVSAHVIGLGPQADRHREMQIADRDVVFLVISAQPTATPATNASSSAPPQRCAASGISN
jgi:hypothetical protein